MNKEEVLIASTGVIAAVVTRLIIQSIGMENISTQMQIIIMYIGVVVYSIKSVREKNIIARKYLIISSYLIGILAILLSILLILKEGFFEIYSNIRVPLGIVILAVFASIVIPVYGAYFAKKR